MADTTEKDSAEDRSNKAANYGWSVSLMNSDKELKKLFDAAVTAGWSPARFVAEVRDTKWFQKQSSAQREAAIAKTVDPATWKATAKSAGASLRDQAARMGAVISDKQMAKMVNDMMVLGLNDAQQQDALARFVNVSASGASKGQYMGQAASNVESLRGTADRNGYKISQAELGKWTQSIASGDRTVEEYQQHMRRQAALMFPSFSDELYAGQDMRELANPYINSMASTLEINAADIDLYDKTLRKGLASKDPKTGKPVATAIYDFEDQLRKDPRWQYTNNAHDQVLGMGRQIAQSMGFSV